MLKRIPKEKVILKVNILVITLLCWSGDDSVIGSKYDHLNLRLFINPYFWFSRYFLFSDYVFYFIVITYHSIFVADISLLNQCYKTLTIIIWNKLLTTCNKLDDIIRLVTRLFQQGCYNHDITILLQPYAVNLVTFLLYHDCIRLVRTTL